MRGMQKQLILNSSDNFTNLDFFKATFFEVKLDKKKMARIFEQKEKNAADFQELQTSKRGEGSISKRERCVSISSDEKNK